MTDPYSREEESTTTLDKAEFTEKKSVYGEPKNELSSEAARSKDSETNEEEKDVEQPTRTPQEVHSEEEMSTTKDDNENEPIHEFETLSLSGTSTIRRLKKHSMMAEKKKTNKLRIRPYNQVKNKSDVRHRTEKEEGSSKANETQNRMYEEIEGDCDVLSRKREPSNAVSDDKTEGVQSKDTEKDNNDTKVDNNDAKVDNNDAEVDNNDTKVDNNDAEVDNNDTKVDNNDTKVDNNDTKVDNNDTKVDNNENDSLDHDKKNSVDNNNENDCVDNNNEKNFVDHDEQDGHYLLRNNDDVREYLMRNYENLTSQSNQTLDDGLCHNDDADKENAEAGKDETLSSENTETQKRHSFDKDSFCKNLEMIEKTVFNGANRSFSITKETTEEQDSSFQQTAAESLFEKIDQAFVPSCTQAQIDKELTNEEGQERVSSELFNPNREFEVRLKTFFDELSLENKWKSDFNNNDSKTSSAKEDSREETSECEKYSCGSLNAKSPPAPEHISEIEKSLTKINDRKEFEGVHIELLEPRKIEDTVKNPITLVRKFIRAPSEDLYNQLVEDDLTSLVTYLVGSFFGLQMESLEKLILEQASSSAFALCSYLYTEREIESERKNKLCAQLLSRNNYLYNTFVKTASLLSHSYSMLCRKIEGCALCCNGCYTKVELPRPQNYYTKSVFSRNEVYNGVRLIKILIDLSLQLEKMRPDLREKYFYAELALLNTNMPCVVALPCGTVTADILLPECSILSSAEHVPLLITFVRKATDAANLKDGKVAKDEAEAKPKRRNSGLWKVHRTFVDSGAEKFGYIIKTGKNMFTEHVAAQFVYYVNEIFSEENLYLRLRPYGIALAKDGAVIEKIEGRSIDSIKREAACKNSTVPFTLRSYYLRTYGLSSTESFKRAQQNFICSLAGYSLVSYLLQLKDRHNGNLLILQDGSIAHVDYGFVFGQYPGLYCIENADFKLTREYLEMMDGEKSELFAWFKQMLFDGFLALKLDHQRLVDLLELAGINSVSLRERLRFDLSIKETKDFIESLVVNSLNNLFTGVYDLYQSYIMGVHS